MGDARHVRQTATPRRPQPANDARLRRGHHRARVLASRSSQLRRLYPTYCLRFYIFSLALALRYLLPSTDSLPATEIGMSGCSASKFGRKATLKIPHTGYSWVIEYLPKLPSAVSECSVTLLVESKLRIYRASSHKRGIDCLTSSL
jgi:hypothetical protein